MISQYTSISTYIDHIKGGEEEEGRGGEDKGVRAWKGENTCTPRQLSRRRGRADM
jgi:hypothetical protein